MMKKGIVQFIPLVAVAAVLALVSIGVIGTMRSRAVSTSSVLASSSENRGKSEEAPGKNKNVEANTTTIKPETNQVDKSKNSDRGNLSNTNFKTSDPNLKKVEDEGVMFLQEGDTNEDEAMELEEEIEATPTVTPGRKVRSNFPITVNPVTNEKTVTTPGGIKTIILPEVAIQNMIKAGFPVVLPPEDEGTPSATPGGTPSAGEGTPSGTTESAGIEVASDAEIQLSELNGELVYEIPAVKEEQFLGVFDVKIKVKGVVSAEDGEIVKIDKSFFDSLLDFLSF